MLIIQKGSLKLPYTYTHFLIDNLNKLENIFIYYQLKEHI